MSRLLARKVIAVSQHDDARAQVEQAAADVDVVRATIRKKTIHAPFAGRLGIRLVNLGQVIASGTPIVSLQSVDPIFVNFSLPQQQLAQVQPGLVVRLKTNVVKDEISGTITAINPQVDASTRNVGLQATVSNPGERLRPGMFVDVTVMLQQQREVLAIPATAVLHAPYGDSVFVVRPAKQRAGGADHPTVHRQFVRLGERRGDFVAVHSGVQKGNQVVSSGVFKLRNDQPVVVDNKLSLRFRLAPAPSDG